MTKLRLADIAHQAGVSEATVSRVLNGKTNVAKATQQQVLDALDRLGYERPMPLRRVRSSLVGLITPELENPIFPALAQVIETALAAAGYTTVLCTQTAGGIHEDEYTQMLQDRGAAGIIFVSGLHADVTISPDRYQRLLSAGLPLVMVNGAMSGLGGVPFISDDDINAMDQAIAHLATLGHRRIGLAVGPDRYVPVIRKIDGYRRAMHSYLSTDDVDDLIEHATFDVLGGSIATTRLLAKDATAVVCASDIMALGALSAAAASGRRVPRDLSVIGYDDSKLMAYTNPPLTTIRQDVTSIGEMAVQRLLALLNKECPQVQLEEHLCKAQLILRGSTGPCAQ